jgi:hypothetical protein
MSCVPAMTDLAPLIERLRAAEEPHPDLDRAIWNVLYKPDARISPPRYTFSLDAAMRLVPDNVEVEIYRDPKRDARPLVEKEWCCCVYHGPSTTSIDHSSGRSNHGAIALCIAALLARGEGASNAQ